MFLNSKYARRCLAPPPPLQINTPSFHEKFEELKIRCKQNSFPNVIKLIQVGITIPIFSSTFECSFLAMRRLKSWLCTSIGQEGFTKLCTLDIDKDLTNKIDGEVLLQKFA